ncbi:MAG TPA: TrmH family RNA methyltransferase [Thermoanaerobaculia bacterium]|nr:TrmH family RNA methyltransferase [Thermoanaerobaculia bacterium]
MLVEPREGGNVGAVARAMKNFGFRELTIVGAVPELHPVAEWWASGAEDVVASSGRAASLADALAGSHLTVATSSGRGRGDQRPLTTRELRERWDLLRDDETLAIVFGRENSGLSARELGACELTASVDTNEDFPVLNLAQSVAIFCYELSRPRSRAPAFMEARPTAEMMGLLHSRTRQLLLQIGFLHENNPHRIYDELQAILARAAITERELTILLGVLRQLEWACAAGQAGS